MSVWVSVRSTARGFSDRDRLRSIHASPSAACRVGLAGCRRKRVSIYRPANLLICLLMGLLACEGSDLSPGPRLTRFVADPNPITIALETRLAGGPEPVVLLKTPVWQLKRLPALLPLPDSLADAESLIVIYTAWEKSERGHGSKPPSHYAEIVEVNRSTRRPSIPVRGLRAFVKVATVNVMVTAFREIATHRRVSEYSATLPHQARLGFGYGLRKESWSKSAKPVRFRAYVNDKIVFSRTLNPADPDHQQWFDETIDLTARAGETVAIRFVADEPAGKGTVFLPVWSEPEVFASPLEKQRPNIILVSLDTLRAQNLGCYGYERDTSPFLDELSAEGVLFERVSTTSATTAPSHMSMFTGRYPPNHGIRGGGRPKAAGVTTLATSLRSAGYRTAAFTENGFLIRENGIGEGFGSYVENVGASPVEVPGQARVTFEQAGHWLEQNQRSPFFLFLHTYQVHWPYDPPAAYRSLFPDPLSDQVPQQHRGMRDAYDREIRLLDDELKKFFGVLKSQDLAESTLVILVGDHGEEFGEHGGFQHGAAVFDEVLRVPLVLWGPGRIPSGRRVHERVSLIDIAPTILDFASVDITQNIDGVSLRPTIDSGEAMAERTLFGEAHSTRRWHKPMSSVAFQPPLVAVLRGDTKYIIHRPDAGEPIPPRGYDLAKDPEEVQPFTIGRLELAKVNQLVDDYLAGRRGQGRRDDPGASSDGDPNEGEFQHLTPEVRERLRLLGYID